MIHPKCFVSTFDISLGRLLWRWKMVINDLHRLIISNLRLCMVLKSFPSTILISKLPKSHWRQVQRLETLAHIWLISYRYVWSFNVSLCTLSYAVSVRYVPEWFPGASFRKKARIWRETISQLPLVPFEAVKATLVT